MKTLGIFLLFVALTLLFTYPLPLHVTTSLYNWSDSLLNTWTLAWGAHALLTDPLNLYGANIFYPYQNTLAYSESLIPQTLLAIPIILATNMPAFAHNLLVLASFVLSAFGMYLLVFEYPTLAPASATHRPAAIVAGLIYAFTSYKLMHFGHLQLLSSQWLPFALLYLRRILNSKFETRNSKFVTRNSLLFALFFTLQALSSFYYTFFIAMAAGLYIACALILCARRWWRGRGEGARLEFPFGALVLAFGVIALLTIPPSLPYFAVQRDLGLERDLRDVEYYVATARTYFSVPDNNLLYGDLLAPKARMTGSGERDFVGFVALGLALVGLLTRPRRDAQKWFYLLLGLVGVILAFGARAEILLFPRWPKIPLPFYLPYHYLFLWVPGFKAMRGPDRFAYLAVLAIAVLAGYGTRTVVEKVRALTPNPSPVGRGVGGEDIVAVVLVVMIILENLALPVRLTNPATLARPLPDAQVWIAAHESDAVILELPMRYAREFLAWPQYFSVFHWRKLVNGFSGFFPPGFGDLAKLLDENFPSDDSLAVLDALGVRYVTVDKNLLTKPQLQALNGRVARFADRVQLEQDFRTDAVYRIETRGWGRDIAALIPPGARVELANEHGDRRVLFEIIAAFLPERTITGNPDAAFRPRVPSAQMPDFVITNVDAASPRALSRRVWANDFVAVYAR